MRHENVYYRLQRELQTSGRLQAQYNNFSSDDEDPEEAYEDEEDEEERDEPEDVSDSFSRPEGIRRRMYSYFEKLKEKFDKYCSTLVILAFNASYDLNLIRRDIVRCLVEAEGRHNVFVIKKQSGYLLMQTDHLKLLDITNYLAQGVTYAEFVKAYGSPDQSQTEVKGFFPYEFLDSQEKLAYAQLPPYEAFYSNLKKINVLEANHNTWLKNGKKGHEPSTGLENYEYLNTLWQTNEWRTLADLLRWYNNLDCSGFVSAVENMLKFYHNEKGIDVFHVAISVPGVARRLLFDAAKQRRCWFSLYDKRDEDLYNTVRKNIGKLPKCIPY
jgi:hypothetical protein